MEGWQFFDEQPFPKLLLLLFLLLKMQLLYSCMGKSMGYKFLAFFCVSPIFFKMRTRDIAPSRTNRAPALGRRGPSQTAQCAKERRNRRKRRHPIEPATLRISECRRRARIPRHLPPGTISAEAPHTVVANARLRLDSRGDRVGRHRQESIRAPKYPERRPTRQSPE